MSVYHLPYFPAREYLEKLGYCEEVAKESELDEELKQVRKAYGGYTKHSGAHVGIIVTDTTFQALRSAVMVIWACKKISNQ